MNHARPLPVVLCDVIPGSLCGAGTVMTVKPDQSTRCNHESNHAYAQFPDLKHAKIDKDRKHRPVGLKMSDTLIMMLCEIGLMVIYGLFVEQEK